MFVCWTCRPAFLNLLGSSDAEPPMCCGKISFILSGASQSHPLNSSCISVSLLHVEPQSPPGSSLESHTFYPTPLETLASLWAKMSPGSKVLRQLRTGTRSRKTAHLERHSTDCSFSGSQQGPATLWEASEEEKWERLSRSQHHTQSVLQTLGVLQAGPGHHLIFRLSLM